MARYLLVAHQTAQRPELLEAARDLAAADAHAEFTLLVPATPVFHRLVSEEGETKEVAQSTARSSTAWLERNGIRVIEAKAGDADPALAIEDELLGGRRYGAIVVSTLPAGVSRWLRMDVMSRLRRQHPRLRLIHVIADMTPTPADEPL